MCRCCRAQAGAPAGERTAAASHPRPDSHCSAPHAQQHRHPAVPHRGAAGGGVASEGQPAAAGDARVARSELGRHCSGTHGAAVQIRCVACAACVTQACTCYLGISLELQRPPCSSSGVPCRLVRGVDCRRSDYLRTLAIRRHGAFPADGPGTGCCQCKAVHRKVAFLFHCNG